MQKQIGKKYDIECWAIIYKLLKVLFFFFLLWKISNSLCVNNSQICIFIAHCSVKFVCMYVKQFQKFVKYFRLNILNSAEPKWETSLSSPTRQPLLLKFLFRSRLSISFLMRVLNNIFVAFLMLTPCLNPSVVRGLEKLREKQQCRRKKHTGYYLVNPLENLFGAAQRGMSSVFPLPVFRDHTYI